MLRLLSFCLLIVLLFCSSFFSVGFVLKTGMVYHISRLRTTSLSSTNIHNEKTISHPYYGLLHGLPDISSAKYYSINLLIKEAAELVKNSRCLYDIIETECQSDPGKIDKRLEEIFKTMCEFKKKNKVWDRKELMNSLYMTTDSAGNFVCLLGGKSTGKSLVLKELSKKEKENRKIIYINMRSDYASITCGFLSVIKSSKNSTLLNSLVEVIRGRKEKNWIDALFSVVEKSLRSEVKTIGQIMMDFNSLLDSVKKEKRPNELLEKLLHEMMQKLPEDVITLVIDEANRPLTITDNSSEAKVEDVIATLALFTKLTKEETKINVILVSSEHAFPFRLADPRLSFNLKDINKFLFAGEVPPNEMYKLLTEEWNLSKNFSLTLIDLYGGHIWDIYEALMRLRERKEDFYLFNAGLTSNIDDCFDDCLDDEITTRHLIEYLKQLSEKGFAPIMKRNEPVAEILSKHDVAGVVMKTSLIIGLPSSVWNDTFKYGLVPTSQSARLVIAEYLVDNQYFKENIANKKYLT